MLDRGPHFTVDLRPSGSGRPSHEVLRIAHSRHASNAEGLEALAERAAAAGGQLLEVDVRLSADDMPLVVHDAFSPLSVNPRQWVADVKFQQLGSDAARKLLTFRTATEIAAASGLGVYCDIKTLSVNGLRRVLEALRSAGLLTASVFASQRIDLLRICWEIAPEIPRSVLFGATSEDPVELATAASATFVHPCWERKERPDRLLDSDWLSRVRSAGVGIVTWHEERPDVLAELVRLGVDAICSDDVGLIPFRLEGTSA